MTAYTFNIQASNLLNANVTTTGANSASLDVSGVVGNVFLNIDARAGGTNTAAVAVTHSEDDSSFSAVPASALFNPRTGDAATFSSIAAAAVDETLALNNQQLKRYVRVEISGTSLDQDISVTAISQLARTEA